MIAGAKTRCKTRRVLLALRLFQDVLEKVVVDDGRAYLQFRLRINFIARVYKSYRKGEEPAVTRCEGHTVTYKVSDDKNAH